MSIEQATGKILYSEQGEVFILKLTGEVRLTLCAAIDTAISKLFKNNMFKKVILDLTEAVSLDSTTLGLLAKLSILVKDSTNTIPALETANPDIIRLLNSMGILDAFELINISEGKEYNFKDLMISSCSEDFVKEKVLEAHKILMNVNDENKETFKELVKTLEAH